MIFGCAFALALAFAFVFALPFAFVFALAFAFAFAFALAFLAVIPQRSGGTCFLTRNVLYRRFHTIAIPTTTVAAPPANNPAIAAESRTSAAGVTAAA
jgi:hypothetical protein